MGNFRREWTPEEADNWTKEDLWASVFSVASYFLLTLGAAMALLVPVWGVLAFVLGMVCAGLMYWVIDPKLRTISEDYEIKQKGYLEDLDQLMKWEEQ